MTNRADPPQQENALVITSAANPAVKALKSLEKKKGRREQNAFLAEGARLISEAMAHDWTPVTLVCGPDGATRTTNMELIEATQAQGARLLMVNNRLLGSIARKENPQTLLATFQPRYRLLKDLSPETLEDGSYVALYQVRDPGNLGTILRTSDFAGVKGVILIGDCCDLYSLETVRASMGSLFAMPVYFATEEEFTDWQKGSGLTMVAASMNGTTPHHTADYGERSLILMGNEQSGLPPHIEAQCDVLSRIPMREGADSLNLGIATALMIYAALGTRGYSI